jgi:hypothetical protein
MRTNFFRALLLTTLAMGAGCADSSPETSDTAALGTGMHLALSTSVQGAEYRLTRGTFTILGRNENGAPTVQVVSVDPDSPGRTIAVPVAPGDYDVELEEGWELSVSYGGPFLPVAATLPWNPVPTTVYQNLADLVQFDFVLGRTELTLGISVSGDTFSPPIQVPEGYDGVLVQQQDGEYAVSLAGQGLSCCWPTVEAARRDFSGLKLYDPAE